MSLTVVIDPHLFDADFLSIDSNRQQLDLALHALRTARTCTFASTRNLKDSYRERKTFLRSIDQNKVKRIMTLLEERLLKPRSIPLETPDVASPYHGCYDLHALGDLALADVLLACEPGCAVAGNVSSLRRVTPGSMGDSGLLDDLARATQPLPAHVVNGTEPGAVAKLQEIIEQLVDGRGWTTIIDPYMARPRGRDGEWDARPDWNWDLSVAWLVDRVREAGKAVGNVPTVTFVSKAPGPGSEPFDHASWLKRFQSYCSKHREVNVRFLIRLVPRMGADRAHGRWMLTGDRCVQVDQGWQLVLRNPPPGWAMGRGTTEQYLSNGWLQAPSRAIQVEEKVPKLAIDTLEVDLMELDGTSFTWVTSAGVTHVTSRTELRQLVDADGQVMTPVFAASIFGLETASVS